MKKIAIDNARVSAMAGNLDMVKEFNFLNMTVEKHSCCGRVCGRQPDYTAIKNAIAALPDTRKQKLKEMLEADEVTVYYNEDGSGTKTLTF